MVFIQRMRRKALWGWKKLRRKVIPSALNTAKRLLRHGNYWYWLKDYEAPGEISITSLVCPLRYDTLIRQDFITFYVSHKDLYISYFDAFCDLAIQHPYYTWFTKIRAPKRIAPDLLGDDEALKPFFADRVREFVKLYESIAACGFNRRFPIILRTERQLLPTATGKLITAKVFVRNGCHRLACLKSLGYTTLPAGYYRVQCVTKAAPKDCTALLVHSIPIKPQAYFTFLSSRYSAPVVFESRNGLVEYVRKNRPKFLDELLSVIRADGFDQVS